MKTEKGRVGRTHHSKPKKQKKNGGGFTIIEALIALAVAGLILLLVFLIVPTAKRNERNYTRKYAVQYIMGELENYKVNYGHYPEWVAFAPTDSRDDFVNDLKTGPTAVFTVRYSDVDGSHKWPYEGVDAPLTPEESLDTIAIMHGHQCNRNPGLAPGDTDYPVKTSALGDRNFNAYAVWTLLEGKGLLVYCQDNIN